MARGIYSSDHAESARDADAPLLPFGLEATRVRRAAASAWTLRHWGSICRGALEWGSRGRSYAHTLYNVCEVRVVRG